MRLNSLSDGLYFTRTEKNASISLSVICCLFFILPQFYDLLRPPSQRPDFEEFRQMIAPAIAQMEKEKDLEDDDVLYRGNKDVAVPELFHFDPNTVSKDELVRLGLSPKVAQTVLNYRNSGGRFWKKEDFKKLYTLRPEDYERLAPYILIEQTERQAFQVERRYAEKERVIEYFHFDPNTASSDDFQKLGLSKSTAQSIINYRSKGGQFKTPNDFQKIYTLDEEDFERLKPWIQVEVKEDEIAEKEKTFERERWEPQAIDINKASPKDWEQFRGVGPSFANRIVKFRESLGGFVSIEQVAETRGLADSTFQNMLEYLQLPSGIYRKIKVNEASLEELKSHPYINRMQASILFNYRKQHGAFSNFEKMKNIRAGFKETDWERLEPYLSFE